MQIVLFGVPCYSRVRLSSQSGFRLGRQPAGAAWPARAESLPYPELVEDDAGGRVVLVVADPGGGEVGDAHAGEGHPRGQVGDLAVDLGPYLGGGWGVAGLELVGLAHLAVDAGVAEEGAARGVGGVGRAEGRAPEE